MHPFFAFKAAQGGTPFYFVQSTARYNVDGKDITPVKLPDDIKWNPVDGSQEVFKDIADRLCEAETPTLVIASHGFNVSETRAVRFHERARKTIDEDVAIQRATEDVVYIGYRWPSERIFVQPLWSTWSSLPLLGKSLLIAGLFIWAVSAFYFQVMPTLAGILFAIPVTIALLRLITYFRDVYRATNYAVADIAEIIRRIDYFVKKKPVLKHSIGLSFVGHSMGGFVVTNVVRLLSDLFDTEAVEESLALTDTDHEASPTGGQVEGVIPAGAQKEFRHHLKSREKLKLGGKLANSVFTLQRVVLVSPDIPGETLVNGRSNPLASSLRRFDEAYLFSNEGDEVLRQLSTIANAFSFPNLNWRRGYRLGNTTIDRGSPGKALQYGWNGELHDLAQLRIGYAKLSKMSRSKSLLLPKLFTYFECTNYIDRSGQGVQGMMTFAKVGTPPDKRMNKWQHAWLLLNVLRKVPDVHSGYFDGPFLCGLIYRLACIGAAGAGTPANDAALNQQCVEHQIKVLN